MTRDKWRMCDMCNNYADLKSTVVGQSTTAKRTANGPFEWLAHIGGLEIPGLIPALQQWTPTQTAARVTMDDVSFKLDDLYIGQHSGLKPVSHAILNGITRTNFHGTDYDVPFLDTEGHFNECREMPTAAGCWQLFPKRMAGRVDLMYKPKWTWLVEQYAKLAELELGPYTHGHIESFENHNTVTTTYGKSITHGGDDYTEWGGTDTDTMTPTGTETTSYTGKKEHKIEHSGTIDDAETPSGSDVLSITGQYADNTVRGGKIETAEAGKEHNSVTDVTAEYGYGFDTPSGADDGGRRVGRNALDGDRTLEFVDRKTTVTPTDTTGTTRTYTDYQESTQRGQKTDRKKTFNNTDTETDSFTNYQISKTPLTKTETKHQKNTNERLTYGHTITDGGVDTVGENPYGSKTIFTFTDGPLSGFEKIMASSYATEFLNIIFADMDRLFCNHVY